MPTKILRRRYPTDFDEQKKLDQYVETKILQELVMLLTLYFIFPDGEEQLKADAEAFANGDSTPEEAMAMYKRLCFFEPEHVLEEMQVGSTCYLKYLLYWLEPQQEAVMEFREITKEELEAERAEEERLEEQEKMKNQ